MSELAAQLVDRVIPQVPVRQWVLLLPFTLRYQLAFDATLTSAVLDVFIRGVFAGLPRAAARAGIADGQGGAITAIQRFGSALNINVHFHARVLDGVFRRPAPGAPPVFHPLPAPTDEEIARILQHIHGRVMGRLRRRGPPARGAWRSRSGGRADASSGRVRRRLHPGVPRHRSARRPSRATAAHRRRGGGR